MARKDVIEVEGKVVELSAKYVVSGGVAQRTSDSGACLRENAIAFHSDLARR